MINMIDFESLPDQAFFEYETRMAFNWLLRIRDDKNLGWAWVEFITPNEQNTAESIYALIEYENLWGSDTKNILKESITAWLLTPDDHAKLSIDWSWVLLALTKVCNNKQLCGLFTEEELRNAVDICVINLLEMQDASGGWPDNIGERNSVIRTSLAVWALKHATFFCTQDFMDRINKSIATGIQWIIKNQNPDGGWGNLAANEIDSKYQNESGFSLAELSYQCDSNASSTGYALVALHECSAGTSGLLNNALKYLRDTQESNGSWPVFTEKGIRDGIKYTFRHFSTAWALQGLVKNNLSDYTDETTINGLNYIANLQDDTYGGWRSSPDADNYTWATCNALVTIKLVKNQLSDIKAKHFLRVICEWWDLKKHDSSYSFSFGKSIIAFNKPMGFLFCIVYTLMMVLVSILCGQWLTNVLAPISVDLMNAVKGVTTILFAIFLGLPWIVIVKNVFFNEKQGWVDAIGWVYGIITGFVLALFQFIV